MAMIAFLSGKAAPGVTTSVALLGTVWPRPVAVVDADPSGGDMTAGWLGAASANGLLTPDRSVLSFAIENQRPWPNGTGLLEPHLQPVPGLPHCRLLAGVQDAAAARFVEAAGWARLAAALANLARRGPGGGADVLVDCGRYGSDTPVPLLTAADLIVVAARPDERQAMAARCLAGRLRSVVGPDRLGLMACAASAFDTVRLEEQVGLYVVVALPRHRRVAGVFSDGARRPAGYHRSRLVRAAARAADLLHDTLNNDRIFSRASVA
jgi:hypothetical protein